MWAAALDVVVVAASRVVWLEKGVGGLAFSAVGCGAVMMIR